MGGAVEAGSCWLEQNVSTKNAYSWLKRELRNSFGVLRLNVDPRLTHVGDQWLSLMVAPQQDVRLFSCILERTDVR